MLKTRLPKYKIVKKDLYKITGERLYGWCGPALAIGLPEKTIWIDSHLTKEEEIRTIAHERCHALWAESNLEFVEDDQVELESLVHVPYRILNQAERALVRYLTNGRTLKHGKSNDLKKIRFRVDRILGIR